MKLIDGDELEQVLRPILTDESCPLHIAAEIDMNIDLMPKVDAVPVRRGHWIDRSVIGGIPKCECSECEAESLIWSSYCPNCGADMRKDGDDGRS